MFRSAPNALNPLALELNGQLEEKAPEVLAMLSEYGRRLYFPKGILSQKNSLLERTVLIF